jgi:hypothetical protein
MSGEGAATATYANDEKHKMLRSEWLIASRNPRRDIQYHMYGVPHRLHVIKGWKCLSKLEIFHLTNAVAFIYRHDRKAHGFHSRLLILESNTGSQDNPWRRLTKTVGASTTVGMYMRSIQRSAKNSLLEEFVSASNTSIRKMASPLE